MQVVSAQESDLPSLVTLFERSFHPVNPYLKQCFPPTQLIHDWWRRTFGDEIKDKDCNILTLRDETGAAVGILCLRRCGSEKDSGTGLLYALYDLTPDHDKGACEPMIEGMTVHRTALMGTRPHFLIELLGVDHAFKGRGLGIKLMQRASEIADDEGLEIFVQANKGAAPFYYKFGYESRREIVMPGEAKYTECLLVRPVDARSHLQ